MVSHRLCFHRLATVPTSEVKHLAGDILSVSLVFHEVGIDLKFYNSSLRVLTSERQNLGNMRLLGVEKQQIRKVKPKDAFILATAMPSLGNPLIIPTLLN